MVSWPGRYCDPLRKASVLKKNKWNCGLPSHLMESRQYFLLFFSSESYLLNTLFLFLVTIDSGLVECFLRQATAEPIFIILEISMSHKINLQLAVPSMGVSFLEFLKEKKKRWVWNPTPDIYQTTQIISPDGRILWLFQSHSRCVACCLKHLPAQQPGPLSRGPGPGWKGSRGGLKAGSDSLA